MLSFTKVCIASYRLWFFYKLSHKFFIRYFSPSLDAGYTLKLGDDGALMSVFYIFRVLLCCVWGTAASEVGGTGDIMRRPV